MIIIGAGLSGLIAAHAFPRAHLIEATAQPSATHAALLRFRSDSVSNLVGIPFKQVEVHKGIWFNGEFCAPTIQLANMYSQKVIGRVADRSIWNVAPVQRFIAPEDFYEHLVDAVASRITWNQRIDSIRDLPKEPIVSTVPMPVMLAACGEVAAVEFNRAPICVARYRIESADVYQTVYFPDPRFPIYRASITGSLLIVESVANGDPDSQFDGLGDVLKSMHVRILNPISESVQQFGKIAPIDDSKRKAMLFKLTHDHGIFSLGRFAIWKNILLDDVVQDIASVRQLMRASAYDQSRHIHTN